MFNYDGYIGGTELMGNGFDKYVLPLCPEFKDFEWAMIPGEAPNIEKNIIAWCHLNEWSNDFSWFKHPNIKHLLFVSNFQQQNYIRYYNLDPKKCHVINNAIEPINIINKTNNEKIKIVYQPDISRGLLILLKAMKKLKHRDDIELHIFGDMDDKRGWWDPDLVKSINDYCNKDNRITTHGRVSVEEVRKQLAESHMFVYPSTHQETSCISLMESMSAGLYCITSNLGALPETSMGFADQYVVQDDPEYHSDILVKKIENGINKIRKGWDYSLQKKAVDSVYSWEATTPKWLDFYDKVVNSRRYI